MKNVKQIAKMWNITERQVQSLCKSGKIAGAEKIGRDWIIPQNAIKPLDERKKYLENKQETNTLFMPKKAPFLDMTDIYNNIGEAEKCAQNIKELEAKRLFEAEIAYRRGEIDKVYDVARYFLNNNSGFYSMISGGMLLSHCAIWKGDIWLWNEGKHHICKAICKNDIDRDIITLSLASTNSSINDTADFPEWFCRGDFELLHLDSLPAARVFYVKYLMFYAQELAKGEFKLDGVAGLGLMRTMPYIIEPMIAQAVVDKTIMVELHLRLLIASAYNDIGDKQLAVKHIDKAIAIALPDKLWGTLAEHRSQLDLLLDERLKLVDEEVLKEVKKMSKTFLKGWYKLHNLVLRRNVLSNFSIRERQIARLAVFGLSDKEISERLKISVSSVKSIIAMAKNKAGVKKRRDLSSYI